MEFKFAYYRGWSDCEPYEVIRVVSENCVELRAMKAEQLHNMKDLGPNPGGFACHFDNQRAQKWDIQPEPANPVIRVRKSKAKAANKFGRWFGVHQGEFRFCEEPYKFYDYNF